MRADVLAAARGAPAGRGRSRRRPLPLARRSGSTRAIDDLPDAALDVVTANGLTAHDLVVHLAAQESLLAQNLGVPTIDDLDEEEIVARTARAAPALRRPRPRRRGRRSGASRSRPTATWAVANPDRTAIWRGLGLTRDDTLLVRVVRGVDPHRRPAARVGAADARRRSRGTSSLMSDLAGRILPLALAVAGRAHDGKTARLVLTGDGGGEWLVAMGARRPATSPDVTVTADVVDWCLLVGDRIDPADAALRDRRRPDARPRPRRRGVGARDALTLSSAPAASPARPSVVAASSLAASSSASAALISATMRAISTSASRPSAVVPGFCA